MPGCEDDSDDAPSGGGALTYSRTGGIAGIDEKLTISEDGSATLTSGGYGADPRTSTFRVPADELDAITSAIEAVGIDELDVGISEGCADCFVYELEYGGETATADSVTAMGEFAHATASLDKLLNRQVR